VYMVFVMIRLFEVELRIVGGDFKEFPIEVTPEFCGDHGMSVFGRKDYVVITEVYAMIVSLIFLWLVHTIILA